MQIFRGIFLKITDMTCICMADYFLQNASKVV